MCGFTIRANEAKHTLTRDQVRYIFDPTVFLGPDFPGETFRVHKEKEIAFGRYRTRPPETQQFRVGNATCRERTFCLLVRLAKREI